METSEKYLLSLQQLSLNEIMKLFFNTEGVKKADEGSYDDALKYFSKAINLPPKDSTSYFNRASLRMYLGDVKGAMSDLKELKKNTLGKILNWIYHIILCLIVMILFL